MTNPPRGLGDRGICRTVSLMLAPSTTPRHEANDGCLPTATFGRIDGRSFTLRVDQEERAAQVQTKTRMPSSRPSSYPFPLRKSVIGAPFSSLTSTTCSIWSILILR